MQYRCHQHLRIPVILGEWFKLPPTTTDQEWSYKKEPEYVFYCMECGEPCREHEGLTGDDLEAWFCEDDELKLCPDCDN